MQTLHNNIDEECVSSCRGLSLVRDENSDCIACNERSALRYLYRKLGFQIKRCSHCGLGKTETLSDYDPDAIYGEEFFQGGQTNGYANYIGSERVLRVEFRRTLAALRPMLPAGGRLLELGCAYGFFLSEAEAHFHSVGLEVSAPAVEFCRQRGSDVFHGTLESYFPQWRQSEEPFDAVVMLDVIEHLADPAATLNLVREVLRPRGKVVITTGDWNSLLARCMGKHWRLMTPPQHLFFFTRHSLSLMLKRIGFRVCSVRYPWKFVPLGLMAYQLGRRIGLPLRAFEGLNACGVPVNLFDAMQIVAERI